MILRGIEQAAFINFVVTIAKLVPILVALIAMLFAFNADLFAENFWGGVDMPDTVSYTHLDVYKRQMPR